MACAIDLDEFLNCEICFEVIDNPRSLACRHVFCGKCVDRIKHGTEIECPVCKEKSNDHDIKPDYRTVSMVDSYRKSQTKDVSVTGAKDNFISKCELCEDDGSKVNHKCETCDFLLCDKCEASHTGSGSKGGSHTTKAIAVIASNVRREINKALKDLKTQEKILASKLSNPKNEIDIIRKTSDNAMTSIGEKEEYIIVKIKIHHDNLRKEVEKEKTKHIANRKQEYKSIEGCYQDVKDKQAMLTRWVNDRSDLSIANTSQRIHKQLQDIEKESNNHHQNGSSVENFTVKVIEGNEYDPNGCTKLIFSTNPPSVSGSTPSDYTTAVCREYTAEKIVHLLDEDKDYAWIDNIQRYNNHLYCNAGNKMYVYTENLALVKTIKLNQTEENAYITALVSVDDKYLITASYTGLRVLDTDGKDKHHICSGEFNALSVHNHKLYAYKNNINKLLIFQQTRDRVFKDPRICSVDSQGNLLVAEPENLTVVRADGKCGELMLRGEDLHEISDACMGDDNECLWVAHFEADEGECNSYITKYKSN